MQEMNFDTTEFGGMADDVTSAIGDLSCEEICGLRNKLIGHEVAFYTEDGEFQVYAMSDIEIWCEQVGIELTESDDLPDYPINYWINGVSSDTSFEDEKAAKVAVFERIVVSNADLSDYDLFTCQKCDGYFDIEDSVQIDGDELYCERCAAKAG